MVSCPNCHHQNPDGAVQCEACYTPLPLNTVSPVMAAGPGEDCPQCGATVQPTAIFCGQCGFNLQANGVTRSVPVTQVPATVAAMGDEPEEEEDQTEITLQMASTVAMAEPPLSSSPPVATKIQTQSVSLVHVQTNIPLNVPPDLMTVHIGKPNDVVPPDIDVSGFPNSEVVSRVHADLRVENGLYFIEDTGSSNGTYINHIPLPPGNRHRLRSGDRIALGKGDKVTFIFQMSGE